MCHFFQFRSVPFVPNSPGQLSSREAEGLGAMAAPQHSQVRIRLLVDNIQKSDSGHSVKSMMAMAKPNQRQSKREKEIESCKRSRTRDEGGPLLFSVSLAALAYSAVGSLALLF